MGILSDGKTFFLRGIENYYVIFSFFGIIVDTLSSCSSAQIRAKRDIGKILRIWLIVDKLM